MESVDARGAALGDGALKTEIPSYLRAQAGCVLLAIKLQPRASREEIGEPLADELRVKVTAPPVDAAANQALIDLLAATLACSRGRVELIRGHASRHKVLRLHGMSAADVARRLARK